VGWHYTVAIAGSVLGASALGIDLGNRLLGSGARHRLGKRTCILLLSTASLAMLVPAIVLLAHPQSTAARTAGQAAGALGLVFLLHFLFPYRFRIRRERKAVKRGPATQLAGGIVLQEVKVQLPDLPRQAIGLKLLLISDIHCRSRHELAAFRETMARVADEASASALRAPDLVCVCGDVGEDEALLPGTVEAVALVPCRLGSFCVRGNHDVESGDSEVLENALARSSVNLLSNEARLLDDGGIAVVGLEVPWKRSVLPQVPPCGFSIGLSHSPDNIGLLRRMGVDFAVCGHTHGGLLRLPGIGALSVPCWHGRFLDLGLFRLGGTRIYIGGGIGSRIGGASAMGEVVLLRLEPQNDAAAGPPSRLHS